MPLEPNIKLTARLDDRNMKIEQPTTPDPQNKLRV